MSTEDSVVEGFCRDNGLMFQRRVHLHSVPDTEEPVYVLMPRLPDEVKVKCIWPNCRHVVAFPTMQPLHNDANKLEGGLRSKLSYLLSYARGVDHRDAAAAASCHENTCSAWRKEVDLHLACAHSMDAAKWAGKAHYLQADEFATGRIKYGAGEPVSKVGQQWFQSVTVTGSDDKVLAFFVRHVKERNKATLQPWILFFAADGCVVTTDGWGGYRDLPDTAATGGLAVRHAPKSTVDFERTLTHIVVNHSENMVDTDGNHSNSVEGMHMHLKSFLAKFNRMGTTIDEVINRVMAAAYLHNPASALCPDRPRPPAAYVTRFQKLLLAYRDVAGVGMVPGHILMIERSTRATEPITIRTVRYRSGDRRKFFEFVGGKDGDNFLASPGRKRPVSTQPSSDATVARGLDLDASDGEGAACLGPVTQAEAERVERKETKKEAKEARLRANRAEKNEKMKEKKRLKAIKEAAIAKQQTAKLRERAEQLEAKNATLTLQAKATPARRRAARGAAAADDVDFDDLDSDEEELVLSML